MSRNKQKKLKLNLKKAKSNNMTVAIDYAEMKAICGMKIEDFSQIMGDPYPTKDGIFYFKASEEPTDILAVAHLDNVHHSVDFHAFSHMQDVIVYSPTLDDRLGAYVILKLLPQLGLHYDILLTEGEETGHTTASQFEIDKKYNWIFEFDRRLDDVVMYQYETPKYAALLKGYGFKVGIGSFSDIGSLGHLGATAFNFGVGYEDEHSNYAHAYMSLLTGQIKRFVSFYKENKDTAMPFEQTKSYKRSYGTAGTSAYLYGEKGYWLNNKWHSWEDFDADEWSSGWKDKEVVTEEDYEQKYLPATTAAKTFKSCSPFDVEEVVCEICAASFDEQSDKFEIYCLEDNECCMACYKKLNGFDYDPYHADGLYDV